MDHEEVLGGRWARISLLKLRSAEHGVDEQESLAGILRSLPLLHRQGAQGALLRPEGLAFQPGEQSGSQDRVCLEWGSLWALFAQGGGLPSASGAEGVASWGGPL